MRVRPKQLPTPRADFCLNITDINYILDSYLNENYLTLGWSSDKRAYWETPSKYLDGATFIDNGRAKTKSDLTREIGSFIKDVKNALKREQEPKKDRAEPRSPLQLFWDHIHKAGDILVNQPIFDDNNVRLKIEEAIQAIYDAEDSKGNGFTKFPNSSKDPYKK